MTVSVAISSLAVYRGVSQPRSAVNLPLIGLFELVMKPERKTKKKKQQTKTKQKKQTKKTKTKQKQQKGTELSY